MNPEYPSIPQSQASFTLTRTFKAPRQLVFSAYTEEQHLARWWGPKDMPIEVVELDLRPGGMFRYAMKIPNGGAMYGRLVYCEIAPPEKLSFISSFTDEHGTPIRHPLSATWPLEVLSTSEFKEENGITTIISWAEPINATDEERETFLSGREGMKAGYKGMLDQLDAHLAEYQSQPSNP